VAHEFVIEGVPEVEMSMREFQAGGWSNLYVALLQAGPMVISRSLPKEATAGPVHVLAEPDTLDACTPVDVLVAVDAAASPGISSSTTCVWAGVVSACDFGERSREGGGLFLAVVCAGCAEGADVADAGTAEMGMLLSKSSTVMMPFKGRASVRLLDMLSSVGE
jgi:hypothetical protein